MKTSPFPRAAGRRERRNQLPTPLDSTHSFKSRSRGFFVEALARERQACSLLARCRPSMTVLASDRVSS